ncbi:MAG: amino acid ABC transporter permease, partial [Neisseria mucosa]|nr:amino acid ABC transporter permease [Neisseria mucosa]
GITIEITALSVGFGLLIGMTVGIARLASIKPVRYFANCYVDFIRGTPLLVQIFLVYFALPGIIGHRVDPYFAAISACSINSGAYIAEIFRAGIQSIDKGQMEAARSLGLTYTQAMRYVILPQALRRMLPPLAGEFITLLKDSSLLSVIAVPELMSVQKAITGQYSIFQEPLYTVALIYLVLTSVLGWVFLRLERRYNVKIH